MLTHYIHHHANDADHRENVKGACCRKLGVSSLCHLKFVLDPIIIIIIIIIIIQL